MWTNTNNFYVYNPNIHSSGQAEGFDVLNFSGSMKFTTDLSNKYQQSSVIELPVTNLIDDGDHYKVTISSSAGIDARTDIPTGSYILDLNNSSDKEYRVLSISPIDGKLYSIDATEYKPEKYNLIEDDFQMNFSETETPQNIGIPTHEIKKATEPTNVTTTFSTVDTNDLKQQTRLNVQITNAGGSFYGNSL